MMVLTRKIGEVIRIGDNIEIMVVDIVRGKIKIGVRANRDVPVFRSELLSEERKDEPRKDS